MNRKQKEEKINVLQSKLKESSFGILTDFTGLNVENMNSLREGLRDTNTEFNVVKNTLIKLAAKDTKFVNLETFFSGPVAIAFSNDDPINTSKVIFKFSKNNSKLKIKGGILNGKILTPQDIQTLADSPGRQAMLSRLVGILKGVQSNLVLVLNGVPRKFLLTLEAIKRQKEHK
ncbi:MAG: 50S ribosomal protein L10 [Thermodesulfobacteriota bacterium]|nr:50S ribosomal protein L10 [Thermodesulfobacteriota bacterium]